MVTVIHPIVYTLAYGFTKELRQYNIIEGKMDIQVKNPAMERMYKHVRNNFI